MPKFNAIRDIFAISIPKVNFKIKNRDSRRINFVSTPCFYGGHRWWFRCPVSVRDNVCTRRVGVLYLGEGEYFGCRHCYNLTYSSSKESGKYDDLKNVM